MSNLNYQFLDGFKKADKICREIYGTTPNNKLGITLYLEDMDVRHHPGTLHVPSWQFFYTQLKDARNLRNELIHGQYALDTPLCTQEDVDFINNFYHQLLTQTDPLALLHKKFTAPKSTPTRPPATEPTPTFSNIPTSSLESNHHSAGCMPFLILMGVLTVSLILILSLL